jgi:hypothetical protein
MSNENTMTFLAPRNAMEAFEIANNLAQSSLIPQAMKGKPADIVVAMAYGAELGLQPLQSLQNIAVINGRPSLWGDAVRALVLNSHDLKSLKEWNEGDVFYCEIIRSTRSGGEITITKTFGDADATQAGLLGKQGTWKQYPDRMKQMRAFGFAARDAYADRLRGFITREEAEDMPAQLERDVTPQREESAIDAIMAKAEQTPQKMIGIDEESFNSLHDAIAKSVNIERLGEAMENIRVSNASELQLEELRKASKIKKKELTNPKPQSFDSFD